MLYYYRKVYSRKTASTYLLWFVAQTGVLQNTNADRVEHYPMSSGYLNETYNMVNHMLAVSWRFVPWTTKGGQIGTLYPSLPEVPGEGMRFA